MADVERVLHSLERVHEVCRSRRVLDAPSGRRLTAHQADLLRYLDRRDPTMVSELADQMGVTRSTMSLGLKRLEAAGVIERRRDPEDRRVTNVRLTEVGERLRDAHRAMDPARVASLLDVLHPDRRAAVAEALSALAEAADVLTARGQAYLEALSGEE